ncbi:hypothetical protein MTO96_037236, partial [Rhipicephalus appendiculatus]
MNLSDAIKHFYEDCVHHSLRCPNCSALVLRENMCLHRKSNCSTHASTTQAHLKASQDSVQEAMFTALEKILEDRVREMKSGLHQVVRDHNTHCDKLNEVSHIVNALKETVIETSETQTEAGIVAVRQVKEDIAAQGVQLDEVVQRIGTFSEHCNVVAEATRQCLQNLEQSNSEIRQRIVADDDRLDRISESASAFEGILDKALERAAEVLRNFKTYVDFSHAANSKDDESGQKASDEKE